MIYTDNRFIVEPSALPNWEPNILPAEQPIAPCITIKLTPAMIEADRRMRVMRESRQCDWRLVRSAPEPKRAALPKLTRKRIRSVAKGKWEECQACHGPISAQSFTGFCKKCSPAQNRMRRGQALRPGSKVCERCPNRLHRDTKGTLCLECYTASVTKPRMSCKVCGSIVGAKKHLPLCEAHAKHFCRKMLHDMTLPDAWRVLANGKRNCRACSEANKLARAKK